MGVFRKSAKYKDDKTYKRNSYKMWPWKAILVTLLFAGIIFLLAGIPRGDSHAGDGFYLSVFFLVMGSISLLPVVIITPLYLTVKIINKCGCKPPSCCKFLEIFTSKNQYEKEDLNFYEHKAKHMDLGVRKPGRPAVFVIDVPTQNNNNNTDKRPLVSLQNGGPKRPEYYYSSHLDESSTDDPEQPKEDRHRTPSSSHYPDSSLSRQSTLAEQSTASRFYGLYGAINAGYEQDQVDAVPEKDYDRSRRAADTALYNKEHSRRLHSKRTGLDSLTQPIEVDVTIIDSSGSGGGHSDPTKDDESDSDFSNAHFLLNNYDIINASVINQTNLPKSSENSHNNESILPGNKTNQTLSRTINAPPNQGTKHDMVQLDKSEDDIQVMESKVIKQYDDDPDDSKDSVLDMDSYVFEDDTGDLEVVDQRSDFPLHRRSAHGLPSPRTSIFEFDHSVPKRGPPTTATHKDSCNEDNYSISSSFSVISISPDKQKQNDLNQSGDTNFNSNNLSSDFPDFKAGIVLGKRNIADDASIDSLLMTMDYKNPDKIEVEKVNSRFSGSEDAYSLVSESEYSVALESEASRARLEWLEQRQSNSDHSADSGVISMKYQERNFDPESGSINHHNFNYHESYMSHSNEEYVKVEEWNSYSESTHSFGTHVFR